MNVIMEVADEIIMKGRQGADVTAAVEELNKAIRLYEDGDASGAVEAAKRAAELAGDPPGTLERLTPRIVAAAGLAMLPLAVYTLLPEVWARAWVWARRNWIVEESVD